MASAETAQVIAWGRDVPDFYIDRHSAQHVARMGANFTLCGARIRWSHITAGDSRRCARCFGVAEKRGYVAEYGDPIQRAGHAPRTPTGGSPSSPATVGVGTREEDDHA